MEALAVQELLEIEISYNHDADHLATLSRSGGLRRTMRLRISTSARTADTTSRALASSQPCERERRPGPSLTITTFLYHAVR